MTQEQEKAGILLPKTLRAQALDTQAEALVAQNKPREALSLYKEALALDDQDFWRLIETGRLELNAAGDVKAAQGYYEQALELAQSLGDQRLASVAHNDLGDTLVRQGRLEEALQNYQSALAIAQALADQDPGNAQARRDLSVSYSKIGDIEQSQGRLEEALQNYQSTLAIAQALADQDPSNAQAQRDLSVSYSKIGDIEQSQGRLEAALQNYQSALAIRQALADQDPSNAEMQRDLSVSYNNIGDIERLQGKLEEALQNYQSDLAIAQALADQDPSNAQAQRDLSISYNNIGDIERRQGRLEEAMESYQKALSLIETLVSLDSENAQWQEDFTRIGARIEALEAQIRAQISEKLDQIAQKTPNAETIVFNEAAKSFEAQPLVKSDTQVVQDALHRLSITLRLVESGGHNIKGIFTQELALLEEEYLNKAQTLVVTQFVQTVADVRFLASDKIKENDLQTDPTCNALLRGLDTIVLDLSTHRDVHKMLESRRKISPELPEGWDEAALKTVTLLTAAASNPPLREALEQDTQTAQDDTQSPQSRQSARYRIVSRDAHILLLVGGSAWGITKQVIENVEALGKLYRFITQPEFLAFLDMILKWLMGGGGG